MNTSMGPQASLVVGILLMLLGSSFLYKAAMAGTRGTMQYWSGFLPLSLISPFVLHLPASKNSLVKRAEGLWVYLLMAPLFGFTAFFCLMAGAEFAGMPAVNTFNQAVHGGRAGAPVILFSASKGFSFPVLGSTPVSNLMKALNIPINLEPSQQMVPENHESLEQVIQR
jgi:hypothetical protein